MVDIVTLVVAVLALLGTISQAAVSGWISFHSEERKRRDRLRDILAKYRDPLGRATEDLLSKLTNIVDHGFAGFAAEDAPQRHREYAFQHTAYVIGQFLAWVHIIRYDTQFIMPVDADSSSREINATLNKIRQTLRTDGTTAPFMIWSGEQLAISEDMIVRDEKEVGGQARCMGYATFCRRWKVDQPFRNWFLPVQEGLALISDYRGHPSDYDRLRCLQHLLVDLLELLMDHPDVYRCQDAPQWCRCRSCSTSVTIAVQPHAKAYRAHVDKPKKITPAASPAERHSRTKGKSRDLRT